MNSFSTNRLVNNFIEEKRRQLEALQEMDRESDTTEQMTFSQESNASNDSRNEIGCILNTDFKVRKLIKNSLTVKENLIEKCSKKSFV